MSKQTHKYLRFPGRNYAFYWYDGKRIRLPGTYNSTESKQAYFEAMAQIEKAKIEEKKKPQLPKQQQITVVELVTAFLDHAKIYYRKNGKQTSTLKIYEISSRYLVEMFGNMKVDKFSQVELISIQEYLDEKINLSRKTVNSYITCIRNFFNRGVERGLVSHEVAGRLGFVKPLKEGRCKSSERPGRGIVSWDLVEKTLPYLPDVVRDMVLIQWETGMRPQDCCGMKWSQIDTSDDIWVYDLLKQHKTAQYGITRYIPLAKECQDILARYKDTPEDQFIFSPKRTVREQADKRSANRKTKVQPSQIRRKQIQQIRREDLVGDAYNANSLRNAVQRAAEKAGVMWCPYQLRHSYITYVANTQGENIAQTLMEHKSVRTARGYIHEDIEKIKILKDIARKMEKFRDNRKLK